MKTFAANKKRSATAVRKARPYVHHPMGPVQRAQQAAMRKILRPDEVQAKPDIGEPDSKHEQEADHVAADIPVPAISGMPGGAAPLQRSENEEPEEGLQRQPEEEEEEPIQAKLIQRQPDNEEEEEPVQAKRIQRQMADMRRIRLSRFGYVGPEVKAQRAAVRGILCSTGVQAKPTIGQPNDKYEQEADRIADQVMAMPESRLQRQTDNEEEEETVKSKPLAEQLTPLVQRQEETPEDEEEPVQAKFNDGGMIQRMSPECEEEMAQRQSEENEDEELQAKSKASKTPTVRRSLESSINGMKGGGQPLDHATRSLFEPRFGYDFDNVRIHTDHTASDTAKSINAKAFTLGSDVVFGSGEYQPHSKEGRRLLGHELTHVVQQNSEKFIQRKPDIPPKLVELRGFLEDDEENKAITHIGTLTPDEVKEVLARREFKELAISAFNDNEMYRAVWAMRGDLYRSLEWMFDEGTNWDKVSKIIPRAPSGKERARSDNWMRDQFVSICNDKEMADAVDLLGGTLLQKLSWMKAEGSNWSLVKAKLKPPGDPQNLVLYADNGIRDFFVSICNDKEMASAVDQLGGTLLQKLSWMKAEGSNWSLVKARLKPPNDPENLALYSNNGIRDFFVNICNDREMAEAVDLLGGTLLQKLSWMKAEGSNWSLVKAKLKPPNDPENLALYSNNGIRDFFVSICNDNEMAEAVDLLGGTLLQKLTWMKAEGSNWSLVKAKLKPPNDPQNLALYGSAAMKKFFVDICNDKTIIEATRLLGGTWTQKTDWMKAEGVTAPVAGEMESMLGEKAKWVPSGPGSGNTFELWASALTEGSAPPLNTSTTINCWEMVLLAAYRIGVIDWQWIHDLYTAMPPAAWIAKMTSLTSPYVPGISKPKRGDLIFFDGLAHVALATGEKDKIYTFWPPPDTPFTAGGTIDKVKISTIKALNDYWVASGRPAFTVTFGPPAW